jgi:acyl carrier protein
MNVQSEELLLQVAADTLNTPRQSLTWESSRNVVEGWDSLGHIVLMLAIEREFNHKFSLEQIETIRNLDDIKRHLFSRQ